MPVALTAQQSFDRAQSALQSGHGATLPELLKLIETLSTNITEVTVPELAELIEKDPVLLAKVISVANLIAHNPGIAPLKTLSHCIHQIGYNRVRTIAVSLLLLQNASQSNSAEQREATTRAVCAGLVAQGTAQWLGTHDPETAFACATLRNFGRIMLAAISPENFRDAIARENAPEGAAFRRRFGTTPVELGRRVLAAARIPEELLQTMREVEPESLAGIATTHDARLYGIVDFGDRLSALALDSHQTTATFNQAVATLTRRFEKLVPDAAELTSPALRHTDARISSFLKCDGVSALPVHHLRRIRSRMRDLSPLKKGESREPADSESSPPFATDSLTVTAETRSSVAVVAGETVPNQFPAGPPLPAELWTDTLGSTGACEPVTLSNGRDDPWATALTLVRDGLGADECWLFHRVAAARSLAITQGVGTTWRAARARAAIRADERTVFGVCLTRREAVVIHNRADPAIAPYIPGWLREAAGTPEAFLLVPVPHAHATNDLVLVGWTKARRIACGSTQLTFVRQLLSTASTFGVAQPAAV